MMFSNVQTHFILKQQVVTLVEVNFFVVSVSPF